MNPTSPRRRHVAGLIATAIAAAAAAMVAPAWADSPDDDDDGPSTALRHGKLFTSTNAAAGNEVLVYQRAASGPVTPLARVATHGVGTGSGLGSQGAVTLSRNGRYLFVVNAGSNTVSTFALGGGGLVLKSVVDSGGLTPISITENDDLVYVLNAGGSGNVAGFRNRGGRLTPLPGVTGTLSAATGTGPAQVGLSSDGDVLVVTEKNTGRLTSFLVRGDGTLSHKTVTASSGAVPFGFAFTKRDVLVVSEAAGSGASSYRFAERSAAPITVTGSLGNTQGAACWVAVTPNGRYAFTANAATSSISTYAVAHGGQLTLAAAQAGLTGPNAGAIDMAVSPDGGQLHVFANRAAMIVSYRITSGGGLVPLGSLGGMPGSAGLAAN